MNKWNPLVASCLGTFMLLIDVTIVTVALPDIAAATHSSFTTLQWVLDAYALVLGALVLGMGALADNIGHKRVYLSGTALFAAASLACGLADSGGVLVAARAVQGVGGAAMFATTIALLHATYSGRDRGVAFGVWGAVSGASAGIGVVLGGVLTQWAGWRWVFMVNLPVSVCAIALSAVAFGETTRRRVRLDVPGIATFSLTAGALIFGIIRGGEAGWGSAVTVGSLAVAALALAVFAVAESRAAQPMLPLVLLRSPRFVGSLVGALGMNFAAFSGSVLLSIWLQDVLRLSAIGTGCALLPMSVLAFVVAGDSDTGSTAPRRSGRSGWAW
ncbi:MFS transporter [Tsukamurella soli]|uniref:MFS transporter n=1 Tax=Tsukamurella soli TaxID=644556 RepID=UPI003622B92E